MFGQMLTALCCFSILLAQTPASPADSSLPCTPISANNDLSVAGSVFHMAFSSDGTLLWVVGVIDSMRQSNYMQV